MKFIKEWSEWNPVINKDVLEFIEKNKPNLRHLWDDSKSEEENVSFLIDYFTEYPDEMKSCLNSDKIKTLIPIDSIKNMAPVLQNIGFVKDFRSF